MLIEAADLDANVALFVCSLYGASVVFSTFCQTRLNQAIKFSCKRA